MKDPVSLIIISIVAVLILALGIVSFVLMYQRRVIRHHIEIRAINQQKQQELLEASLKAEEEERRRIAAELHDDVGATLSSIKLFLSGDGNALPDADVINHSRQLLDETIKKVRSISHKLQPETIRYLGLHAALESMAETLSRSPALKVDYGVAGSVPKLPESAELAVYRIMQELVSNAIKHAGATAIQLRTQSDGVIFSALMTHNGKGITQTEYEELVYKKGAIGLKNIEQRLQSVSGAILFEQTDEQQYRIRINMGIKQYNHGHYQIPHS